ncbi:MAG: cell division protein FtsL [Xanthomonadales bacterium]|nr:cell division protein FtsL [Xanthomonadales bacterium]
MSRLRLAILLALIAAVVGSAVAVAWARHQSRALFVELRRLERVRDQLEIEFGRLQIERATLAEVGRIERLARERLGLGPADPRAREVIGP